MKTDLTFGKLEDIERSKDSTLRFRLKSKTEIQIGLPE